MCDIVLFNITKCSNKIAAFDLDHTLIEPNHKKIFPKDYDDWLWKPNIKCILKLLNSSGWTIVVFTNQGGKNISREGLLYKFNNIKDDIDIDICFIASIARNYNRKPFPGMWNQYKQEILNQFNIDIKHFKSFYCGDAFDNNHKALKANDLKFSININVPFIKNIDLFNQDFNSNNLENLYYHIDYKKLLPSFEYCQNKVNSEKLALIQFIKKFRYIFLVSPPSSGKTTFCKKYLVIKNYLRLSKDEYKEKDYYTTIDLNYNTDKLVFDNTNYLKKSRDKILKILYKNGVQDNEIGYIYRDISKESAFYLNSYRHFISKGKYQLIPEIAIHKYYKSLELPNKNIIKLSNWIDLISLEKFVV